MAKPRKYYSCTECGHETAKWQGQCPGCAEWHTLIEQLDIPESGSALPKALPAPTVKLSEIKGSDAPRFATASGEVNRVLGGGLVNGSVVLVGGEPGIGKSTLLLQLAAQLEGASVLYITGEESLEQVQLRATRLGLHSSSLELLQQTHLSTILATLETTKPKLAIIDSIQTVQTETLPGAAGTVAQIRTCTSALIELAKAHNIAMLLVGHVTKEGELAGPKFLEHMVDVVLYLEGDAVHQYRILRASKNRFGDISEIGLLEMQESGLIDISGEEDLFVSHGSTPTPGTVRTLTLEGSRPLLVEIQALTIPTVFGYPKRTSDGFPLTRLQLLVAVLTRHADIPLLDQDVYANVVGGLRLTEPAMDLPTALAVAGSRRKQSLPADTIVLGELSLSGAIRPVRLPQLRLKEAARLGIHRALVAKADYDKMDRYENLQLVPAATIADALQILQ